ncbi:site-specific DNA-methyltransferase (plasmid) [Rhodococcoides fascians]|uniref:site-specific DNA-methyltransferase n=1 Tax=Rhodococcoides fascians TaxID=1828 RepID=UPI00389A7C46
MIDRIADPSLRQAMRHQIDSMLNRQSFGLVYQAHKPETVELPRYKVRRGCKVRIRNEDEQLYRVEKVSSKTARIVSLTDVPERWDVAVEELIVIREFGEAIYPGLKSLGSVGHGGESPPHVVINAENFHGLETLLYAFEETVDAIYIDPPYNSGARDWKYNNDYVDGVDQYRHSKWLAFMQRRLELAKRLLNPASSVLIVTIDEKEVHHLGMLLEQMFPESVRQMVTIVINAAGQARRQELARVDEYAFFVFIGDATPEPGRDDLLNEKPSGNPDIIRWESLLRSGTNSRRSDRPALFYPIFIDPVTRALKEIGEPKDLAAKRSTWKTPKGTVAVWPLKSDGAEGNWRVQPKSLRLLFADGHAKVGEYREDLGKGTIWYLGRAARNRIESGEILVVGTEDSGAVIVRPATTGAAGRRTTIPKTVWNRTTHHSGWHGSALVRAMLPGRDFPFPKSLYAVEDSLRVAVGGKKDALVLDFFAGSGTTAHALARLNAQDGGLRRSILITNNEVSPAEAVELTDRGFRPGDPEWEERGIFHHITRPRIEAAITGVTHQGREIQGEYADGQLFAAGLPANAEFFELTYEDPDLISLGRKFHSISPLLWLKSGGRGGRIDQPVESWSMPDNCNYGILFDTDHWREFVQAVTGRSDRTSHAYVVTDSEATFQQIISELPSSVDSTRLYGDYLRTFEINTKANA